MIRGLVQGVGFRPFICRLASYYGLSGNVDNRTDGVLVNIEGEENTVKRFGESIVKEAPPASKIKSIEYRICCLKGFNDFSIRQSENIDDAITEISPDIAVCAECLKDMKVDITRFDYPFTNCTNCGPRFTIVEGLPYDRERSSMKNFNMCGKCSSEYININDRRFHAQPVACNNCGPQYKFESSGCELEFFNDILLKTAERIKNGKSVAIKGIGGYHLICNALDDSAVTALRHNKHRDSKPFAVMFRDIEALSEYCFIDEKGIAEITSWRRPIMILKQKKSLPGSVNSGLNSIGAVLPYMPFHYQLFTLIETPAIILTSGNISDEPLVKDDIAARSILVPVTEALISYNRDIVNRADDSVIRMICEKPFIFRRSRGYVPEPVETLTDVEGIIAVGADQKCTFCIGKGREAIMSQYLGDMKNLSVYEFFNESLERFREMFRFKPLLIACDLHPDFLSSAYARNFAKEHNIPVVPVQHHHAHIVSCMAENFLNESVIGVSLDGSGYGTDGSVWGGEFMIADLKHYSRYTHFDYVPLPGGDKAVEEPWRMAYSYLYRYFKNEPNYTLIPAFNGIPAERIAIIREMIDKNINSPLSSGAGRLFDAVSAILGLCRISRFDAESPQRLESVISCETDECYGYETGVTVVFAKTLKGILDDLGRLENSLISAKFHNTVAAAITDVSEKIRSHTSINKVVLSGGVFQNKYLTEKTVSLLGKRNFTVFLNRLVPANDGGISLGQLITASKSDKYVLKCASKSNQN